MAHWNEKKRGTWLRNDYGSFRDWVVFTFWGMLIAGWIPPLACGAILVSEFGGADGHHVGYVTAVEDQSNATWDSTVVYVKSNPESTQEDKYCVTSDKVRDALDLAARDRVPVVIHYRNDFIMWRWECNGGDSIIVGVEPAPSPEGGAR